MSKPTPTLLHGARPGLFPGLHHVLLASRTPHHHGTNAADNQQDDEQREVELWVELVEGLRWRYARVEVVGACRNGTRGKCEGKSEQWRLVVTMCAASDRCGASIAMAADVSLRGHRSKDQHP